MLIFDAKRHSRRKLNLMKMHILPGALAILLAAGCAKEIGEADSPERLARAVVDALNKEDRVALHSLRVQKEEHLRSILPAFQPIGFPPEFAWNNLNKKCIIGVSKWVKRYGGESLSLAGILFEKPEETYKGLKLLRGTVLTVQTRKGEQVDLRILGSVVLRDGRYKLLSYDD